MVQCRECPGCVGNLLRFELADTLLRFPRQCREQRLVQQTYTSNLCRSICDVCKLSRSDLWNFSQGALSRGQSVSRISGSGAVPTGGVVADGLGGGSCALPRIKSPYNTVGAAGLAPTTLAPEEARSLYGAATAVPGLGDDDHDDLA